MPSPGRGPGDKKDAASGDKRDAGSGDPAYSLPVATKDAPSGKHGEYDTVLANSPFDKKSALRERRELSTRGFEVGSDDFDSVEIVALFGG